LKALVLGGTGRIGSAVAWDLARYGEPMWWESLAEERDHCKRPLIG